MLFTTPVDLMGRLSNPPETLECVADQGECDTPPPTRTTSKGTKQASNSPERAIWKKRDSFQTLCSGGCLRGVVDELVHHYEEGASIDALATAVRRPPDHDHRPPRSARRAPTPRRPENDRPPGRPSLRALLRRAFACRCCFRVRCPRKDAGPGVSAGWDAHQSTARLELLSSHWTHGLRPGMRALRVGVGRSGF